MNKEKIKKELQPKHVIGGVLITISMFIIINTYEDIIRYLSTFKIAYQPDLTIVLGCCFFPIIVLIAIFISQMQHYMGIKKQKYILNNPGKTWKITWCTAGVCLFFSYLFKHHLYYIYLYFFAVGVLSFLNYLRPYAIIDKKQVILFYGPYFFRKKINLVWENISKIDLVNKKDTVVRTYGSRIWVPIKEEVTVELVSILLKKAVASLPNKKNIKGKKLTINDIKTEIILEKPPNGGFRDMLRKIACFSDVETGNERNAFRMEHKLTKILFGAVFLLPLAMLLITRMLLNVP